MATTRKTTRKKSTAKKATAKKATAKKSTAKKATTAVKKAAKRADQIGRAVETAGVLLEAGAAIATELVSKKPVPRKKASR